MNYFFIAFSFFLVAWGQPAGAPYLGIVSSVCGFALFWRAMLHQTSRFWLPVLWFTSVQAIQLMWLASPQYMGMMILPVYAGLVFAMGLQFGLLSYFFVPAQTFHWRNGLAMAGAWTLFEWVRLFVLTGFPFNPVGLSLTDTIAVQWASVGGIYWLSFWVIWVNTLCFNALLTRKTKPIALFATAAFLPYLFGLVHPLVIKPYMTLAQNFRVGLMQTALMPEQRTYTRLFPSRFIPPIAQWKRVWNFLSADTQWDLIILPEAAFPYGASRTWIPFTKLQRAWVEHYGEAALSDLAPLEEPNASATVENGKTVWKVSHKFIAQSLANHLKTHLIVGLDDEDASGKYNAAFHFQPHRPIDRYEKRILVPVSEYLPLENVDLLSAFYAKEYQIFDSLTPGSGAKIFSAQLPIGPSICYEELFGHAMRQLRQSGAQLFVNVTNDVWYPETRLPQQHFHHARIRSAENGVYLLRACNTGVTGGADCFGASLPSLPISHTSPSFLTLTLPLQSYPTLYTLWGNWAILLLSVLSLAGRAEPRANKKSF